MFVFALDSFEIAQTNVVVTRHAHARKLYIKIFDLAKVQYYVLFLETSGFAPF